jgi:uncharacterized protein (TIGR02001 family)
MSRLYPALLAVLFAAPVAAQTQGWGGSVGATSDYVYRGLTQSNNEPAGQADVHYYGSAGWFAGLWASTVKRSPYSPTTGEFDAYLGWNWQLPQAWSARLFAVHHEYPWNNPGGDYNYDELSGTLAYADRASLTVAFSPDYSFDGPCQSASGRATLSYDLSLHQPLYRALSANAGVGYYDLRWAGASGYVYWNAGLGYDFGRLQLDLSYIGTNESARGLYYPDIAVNRLVGTLLWHF